MLVRVIITVVILAFMLIPDGINQVIGVGALLTIWGSYFK